MGNENNRYPVIVSVKAAEILKEHVRFLANATEEAARNFIKIFNQSIRSFEMFSERNPWLTDQALPINKYRKLIFGKRYILIYQVKAGKVYLNYVLECRQVYDLLL